MNQYPKISIVTPSFNQGDYIEETILSVVSQGYPNLEYIIIDGGSTDSTIEIVKKYEQYLSYWVSEKDNGLYDALMKGFARSSGEIMLWINSDDLLHKHAFQNIVDVFGEFKEVEWITGINTAFDEKSRTIKVWDARKFSKYNFFLNDFKWIQQESTVWRRSLWDKTGGYVNSDAKLAGDFELWLRFIHLAPLYTCSILIGGFRFRSKNQLSTTRFDEYTNEVYHFIDQSRNGMRGMDKIKLFVLRSFKFLRVLLKYSILLDIVMIDRLMKSAERRIHQYPSTIFVNWRTGHFERD